VELCRAVLYRLQLGVLVNEISKSGSERVMDRCIYSLYHRLPYMADCINVPLLVLYVCHHRLMALVMSQYHVPPFQPVCVYVICMSKAQYIRTGRIKYNAKYWHPEARTKCPICCRLYIFLGNWHERQDKEKKDIHSVAIWISTVLGNCKWYYRYVYLLVNGEDADP